MWFLAAALSTSAYFGLVASFHCDGLPSQSKMIPDPQASQLIKNHEWIKPSLEVLFGGLPGAAIGFFILEKFLSNAFDESEPSVWDQVKEGVEKMIHDHIDEVTSKRLCDDLEMYRTRIELCLEDIESARSICLKNLLDQMIGSEAHYKFTKGREIALSLPLYTMYSVMTLAVGNMFMKQNNEFPIKGAATLSKIKPAARRFSTYVNDSIPKVVAWRKMEIGYYTKYVYSAWRFTYKEDGKGRFDEDGTPVDDKTKRSLAYDELSNKALSGGAAHKQKHARSNFTKTAVTKRRMPDQRLRPLDLKWFKLTVTDKVNGSTVYEGEKRQDDDPRMDRYRYLNAEAKAKVLELRTKAESELKSLYEKEIQSITNQYWRIYDNEKFGNIDLEMANRKWLSQLPVKPK